MSESLEKTKNLISLLKKKNPAYTEILDFYKTIVEEQEAFKPILKLIPLETSKDLGTLQVKDGFPLINKEDFILDITSSVMLFESLCKTGKNVTDKMKENILAIEDAIRNGFLDIEKLLERHYDKTYTDKILEDMEIDETVLNFLIHMSIKPSINLNVEKLRDKVALKNWLRGYCPICGSFPHISELIGEGQRYLMCSFCSFKWPSERLRCPSCENNDHKSLHYFYEEGQEVYRVDVCDKCMQYIKTVDSRKLDYEPDLNLEDIMTIHLDILASEKGFKRPVPSPWGL
jgi:FdhE protein